MKPLNEKDKPKLFALIGLSVLVLGFGAYQITAGMAGAAPPPPPPKEEVRVAEASPAEEAAALAFTGGGDIAPNPSAGRDPFSPQINLSSVDAAPARPAAPGPPLPNLGVPGAFVPGGASARSAASPKPEVVVVPPPPPPTLTVSGVLVASRDAGGRSVAVLTGGGDRRYVTVGDPVGNGFVVSAVSLDGVEVVDGAHGTRRFTFRLVGKQNATNLPNP